MPMSWGTLRIQGEVSQRSRYRAAGKVRTHSLVLADAPGERPFVDHAPRGEVQALREAEGGGECGPGPGSPLPAPRRCPGAGATLNSAASGLLVLSSEVASRRFW